MQVQSYAAKRRGDKYIPRIKYSVAKDFSMFNKLTRTGLLVILGI